MPAVGTVTIQGNVSNLPTGTMTIGPLTLTTANAVGENLLIALSSGANTIALPTGTTVVFILGPNASVPQPNPNYAGVLTLKGVSGDTGIAIANDTPTMLSFDSSPANIVINASVATSIQVWVM